MLKDYPAEAIGVGGDQTTPATPTKLNPRKTTTKPTHQRRTVTDPAKCVFVQQILAIRAAEAEGKRSHAETLKNKLISSSRGFIRKMAMKYYGDDVDQDDVDATATMAFWRAVTTWQPAGGSPFDTWARWGMRQELQKMVRASRMIRGQKQERVSLASLDGGGEVATRRSVLSEMIRSGRRDGDEAVRR
jgi:DNA-directed RNA polymerase sigma subunit (sigma70/sigma32)